MPGSLTDLYFGTGGDAKTSQTPAAPASTPSSLTDMYFGPSPPITPTGSVEPQTVVNQPEDLQIGPWDTGIQMPIGLTHFLEGAGRGMVSVGRNVGNILGLESPAAMKRAHAIDAPLLNTSGGYWGNVVGQTADTLPLLGGEGALASRVPMLGEILSNPWALSSIQGATQGFLTSNPDSRVAGTVLGGTLGPLMMGAGRGANLLFRGVKASPMGQRLIDAGIGHLTPHLIAPRSFLGSLEQGLSGTPILGDVVNNRTALAKDDILRTLMNRAIPEGGEPLPASTRDNPFDWQSGLSHTQKQLDEAYAPIHGHPMKLQLTFPGSPPVPLRDALDAELNYPAFGLTGGNRSRIAQDILDRLDEAVQARGGNLDSGDLISLRSDLRADAAPNPLGDSQENRAKKQLYGKAVKRLTQILHQQLPDNLGQRLDEVDKHYSLLAKLESAGVKAGGREGGPTWEQLERELRQRATKKAVAPGRVPNQDLVHAARQTFSNQFPMTGFSWMRAGLPAIAAGLDYKYAPGNWKYVGIPAAALAYGAYSSPAALNYLTGQTKLQQKLFNPILNRATNWLGSEFRNALPLGAGVSATLPGLLEMTSPAEARLMSLVGGNG